MNPILLSIFLAGVVPPFQVQTLDGQTMTGGLVELNRDRLTLDAVGGRKSVDTEQLLSISVQPTPNNIHPSTGITVEMTDDSTVLARQYVVDGPQARVILPSGETLEVATDQVRSVLLQATPGISEAAEWSELLKQEPPGDLLVVRKAAGLDNHRGVLHDVTEDTLQFEIDGERLSVKRGKVFGLVYRHPTRAGLPPTVCRITDAAGSQWSVARLDWSAGLHWTTPAGLRLTRQPDQIARIDFSNGKIVYLSDLKPESVRWVPYFDAGKSSAVLEQFYAPRFDRGLASPQLLLDGIAYRKGLALHSRTEMVYRLPDRFGRFRAMAGIDDAVRPHGKVRLSIRGDDKHLLDLVITGNDAPRPIDLNLAGVRRLTIVVDFGESLSGGNYLLLCDARLNK
jgi:hypothetical protein